MWTLNPIFIKKLNIPTGNFRVSFYKIHFIRLLYYIKRYNDKKTQKLMQKRNG